MIGQTLAKVRAHLGVDRREMAQLLGVAKSTCDAYEATGSEPADEVLDKLLELVRERVTDADLVERVESRVADIRAQRKRRAPYAGSRAGAQTTATTQRLRQQRRAAAAERAERTDESHRRAKGQL
jgi:transcriptional regulator with XRE-family HTH domain